jgi:hypothetical protein
MRLFRYRHNPFVSGRDGKDGGGCTAGRIIVIVGEGMGA